MLMQTAKRLFWGSALATVLCGLLPGVGRADLIHITGDAGLNGLGFYQGTLEYTDTDAHHATLTVSLTNTSPTTNGGYLTGFVFNNPHGDVTGVALTGPAAFKLLGGATFQNGINGAPFGHFDIGAAVGGSFEGGGKPSPGIGVGHTGAFVFALNGTSLDTLTVRSFTQELSVGPGIGEGAEPFVARFRGFNNGGSDKVPDSVVNGSPEPGTLALAGVGLFSLVGYRWWRRQRAA
jgi:hypothetical protein